LTSKDYYFMEAQETKCLNIHSSQVGGEIVNKQGSGATVCYVQQSVGREPKPKT